MKIAGIKVKIAKWTNADECLLIGTLPDHFDGSPEKWREWAKRCGVIKNLYTGNTPQKDGEK